MKPHTAASCFTTYLLPHVLFVPDFAQRKKAVQACCLAWNISLSADPAQRERHIDMVWNMVAADNRETPPPGLEQGFKQDLRNLIVQKLDLFSSLATAIPKADLVQRNGRDALNVQADGRAEETMLVTDPDALQLPVVIEALRGMLCDTAGQVQLLRQARQTPGVLRQVVTGQMALAYCVQRSDLLGYHRMLTVWRERQAEPGVKRVIDHWLGVLAEIETNSKTILAVLREAGTLA